MAGAPVFATTPRIGVAAVSTANTNRDGTGTIVDVLTGVSAGTRIERVTLEATVNPADSLVTMFLYNGSTYFVFDDFDIGDPAAATTTVPGFRTERAYSDLILPSASWKVAFAISVALTSGQINAYVFGTDLT
jgi:hypothetical protein